MPEKKQQQTDDDKKDLLNRMIAASLELGSGTGKALAEGFKVFSEHLDPDNITKLDAGSGAIKGLATGTSKTLSLLSEAVLDAHGKLEKSAKKA